MAYWQDKSENITSEGATFTLSIPVVARQYVIDREWKGEGEGG